MAKKSGKRRARGEGTIRQRKDGTWEAIVSIGADPLTGKLQRKSFYGKSQGEVKEKRDNFLMEVKTGTHVDPDKTTFGEWVARWLDLYVKPKVKMSTYAKYITNFRKHILPDLGPIRLQVISTEEIQKFYNTKSETLSSSVIAILHQIINGALKQAVRQTDSKGKRLILNNPAQYTSRPTVTYKEIPPMTEKEMHKYLESAKTERLYAAFLLDITSGLRKGETLAVRWPRINFDTNILTVSESLGRIEIEPGKTALVFSEPKTASGQREVPLLPIVVQELKAYRARQAQEKLKLGSAYNNTDLVFTNELGQPVDPRTFLKIHKRIIKRAGLRQELTVHSLRHGFGTMLAKQGVNPKYLQILMGHADIRTTLQTYTHVDIEDKKKAVELLQAIISN
ncbi:MAG: site-specific integrase [Firmicutes bacterium HGW-Firmicutes-14]|jgi:integrase|nr:MAG: site-specific integrase [Firmicutes bacterium HGW-Firmicutes-14]